MRSSYLKVRLDRLRQEQNADGGWGFYPGKKSWLESTAYAAMALRGEVAAERAWHLLRSWQTAEGGWPPAAAVGIPGWGTALCVTLALSRDDNESDQVQEAWQKGVWWLLQLEGKETGWAQRVFGMLGVEQDRDPELAAWPWKPGNSSWVEPTAHALVALKGAAASRPAGNGYLADQVADRIRLGEEQLRSLQCADGGWNYGAPTTRGLDNHSYPETTALALVGLQGVGSKSDSQGLARALDRARAWERETESPLARAWLRIALRLHGTEPDGDEPASAGEKNENASDPMPADLSIVALQALSAPDGNYRLLGPGIEWEPVKGIGV